MQDTNLIQTKKEMMTKFGLYDDGPAGIIVVTFIYKDGVMRGECAGFDGGQGHEFVKVSWKDHKNPKAKVNTGVPFEHVLLMEVIPFD